MGGLERRIQDLERRYGHTPQTAEERARLAADEARLAEYDERLRAELEEMADAEAAEGDTSRREALEEVKRFEREWRGED